MSEHNINLIRYGEQIETDVESMNDGMFELFDDLCDMALSRVYNQTPKINNRFDFNALNKNEVSMFKNMWLLCLAELMFYGMRKKPGINELKKLFYKTIYQEISDDSVRQKIMEKAKLIPDLIFENKNFVENDIFSAPTANQDDGDPRNKGLGPELSSLIVKTSFGQSNKLGPILVEIEKVVQIEFNNAYGHCSIACSKFTF